MCGAKMKKIEVFGKGQDVTKEVLLHRGCRMDTRTYVIGVNFEINSSNFLTLSCGHLVVKSQD